MYDLLDFYKFIILLCLTREDRGGQLLSTYHGVDYGKQNHKITFKYRKSEIKAPTTYTYVYMFNIYSTTITIQVTVYDLTTKNNISSMILRSYLKSKN